MSSILVTGGSGQLGQSIRRLITKNADYKVSFPKRQQLNLEDSQSIRDYFNQHTVDLIINCAAYTAVDKAESEPEQADQLNHLAVKRLAKMAVEQNAKLIHISTDYVFAGISCKPYVESDDVAPQGVYGLTKLKGEQAILSIMPDNAVIIRTSWLYSEFGNNFVKTMLKLGEQRNELNVVSDQLGTPTYAGDLAQAIICIVQSEAFNQTNFKSSIYHYSNEGVCSWYDFAKTIFELSGIDCSVSPIASKDYPTLAKRPNYNVLNKAKIKQAYALDVPYWKESLQSCLRAIQGKAS
ncbi:MAG: dTDP-4-dehydrorhamnose reductase [Cycloclasticus sp.]|nr:MAG: dTDP-4-dehydrorhamnose reductase [Cycloclasticus sp.]